MVGGGLGLDRGTGGRSEWLLLVSYLLDILGDFLLRVLCNERRIRVRVLVSGQRRRA